MIQSAMRVFELFVHTRYARPKREKEMCYHLMIYIYARERVYALC